MDDVIVASTARTGSGAPHQGYPLRLVVPGFQGKYHVKWLRRLRLVKRPLMSYWEKHHFLDRGHRPGGEARASDFGGDFYLEQGPKSVITFPSGEQPLPTLLSAAGRGVRPDRVSSLSQRHNRGG